VGGAVSGARRGGDRIQGMTSLPGSIFRGALRTIRTLTVYVARRTLARPGLLAVRFVGALVAVVLVAGVSLYSAAMGDAMLQSSLRTDSSSTYFAVSLSNAALSEARYRALDGYIRRQEAGDLGLPLHMARVHHGTASVSLYRLQSKP